MRILVTGATGYIGGRLVQRLLDRGHEIRILVRDPRRILGRNWKDRVDVRKGDLSDAATLEGVTKGVDAAFYLVHSMYGGGDFARKDREAADNFVAAASADGLPLLVYLGGIMPGPEAETHSEHLRSRAEVGRILREGLPTTELRAGPIIGSGSASFEMVRYLTERLPAMVAPRWIRNEVQPIAVRDILAYLIQSAEHGEPLGVLDVGTDPLTFQEMMEGYAQVRGLRRYIIPVPILAPRLAGLWVGLVTPIPHDIALPLVEGVVQPVVGDPARGREIFPDIRPISYLRAVELALERIETGAVPTRWSGALGVGATFEYEDREGIVREVRTRKIEAPPEAVFQAFASLGGNRGWLVWNTAWWARGILDQLFGGPGIRRGRRHPTELQQGEAVDFWRVEAIEPGSLLRLRAEMRVPGRAWLQWEAVPEAGGTRLVQSALFAPAGLFGVLYWYSLFFAHAFIFSHMIDAVGALALRIHRGEDPLYGPAGDAGRMATTEPPSSRTSR
ncbi:MAG: SDR family oxidoreductase [Gemmatimonadales bacterium]|nr:MAG: SDR family oxidoreductase [Gemmatimonadales bacterium]